MWSGTLMARCTGFRIKFLLLWKVERYLVDDVEEIDDGGEREPRSCRRRSYIVARAAIVDAERLVTL